MSSDQQTGHEFGDSDPHRFMQVAQQQAKMGGACVLEFFTCDRCQQQQTSTHAFCESLPCARCGNRMASKVPRLPQPGEMTVDGLVFAITQLRQAFPLPNDETRKWIERQEGAVKCVASAYAMMAVHRVLDTIQEIGRATSGGHQA